MAKPFFSDVIIKIDVRSKYLDGIKTFTDGTSAGGSAPMTFPNLPGRLTADDIVSAIREKITDE